MKMKSLITCRRVGLSRVATWNIDSLSGTTGKMMLMMLADVVFVQEMRWIRLGCSYFSAVEKEASCFVVDVRRKLKVWHYL